MRLPTLLILLALSGCKLLSESPVPAPNTLSVSEQQAGWKLLFDGKTNAGWKSLNGSAFPAKGWVIKEGALQHVPKGGGGDIVTAELFTDFELAWEWSVEAGANSGVKYRLEAPTKATACEYQVIDDEKHEDAKKAGGKRTAGSLYDVVKPAEGKTLKPIGEWNQSRIVAKGNRIEHWLNGVKVVEVDTSSEEFTKAVAASKFKNTKGWGQSRPSPILLQDHGDGASFRNLKIRSLAGK